MLHFIILSNAKYMHSRSVCVIARTMSESDASVKFVFTKKKYTIDELMILFALLASIPRTLGTNLYCPECPVQN